MSPGKSQSTRTARSLRSLHFIIIEDGFSESWLYPADLDLQYPTVRIDTQAGWEVSFQSATPPPYQHSITYTRRAAFRKPPLLSLFESQIPIDSYVIIDIAIMSA
ncbi:hypothetical protein IFR04_016186 [Cadophora malorum]|uniref:Uncharacterized protein n=1 Tax=Cadophora malorum TaxID=108018 RepID=A0A8H7VXS5_9HELO|nr:hypothetical protein IFR04_016186 [Cadophora malorum]